MCIIETKSDLLKHFKEDFEILNASNLKNISVPVAEEFLAEQIGVTEGNKVLKDIINELFNKDKKIDEMDSEEIKKYLNAIYIYKIICNLNDAEGRCSNTISIFKKDIYKDSLHFFLELIQNADDASKGGDEHELKISIEEDYSIEIIYDERGFNFSDVFSLTSIGNSSKKKSKLNEEKEADIGEKGIGFKSIFAIVEKVIIESKYFNFEIVDKENEPISILLPSNINVNNSDHINNETKLTLQLKEAYKNKNFFDKIDTWMKENICCNDIANPFLFLKNICIISYNNKFDDMPEETVTINRGNLEGNFNLISIGTQKYLKYSSPMEFGKRAIVSRWEHLKNELVDKPDDFKIQRNTEICFPLDIKSYNNNGRIYSYLPTNIDVNFPVFINLDVHLTASRGNITTEDFVDDSLWNEQVEENLSDFLKKSYLGIVNAKVVYNKEINDAIMKIREHLYNYLPHCETNATTNTGTYNTQIKKFVEDILNESIFKANDEKYHSRNNIAAITTSIYEENTYYRTLDIDEEYSASIYNFFNYDEYNVTETQKCFISNYVHKDTDDNIKLRCFDKEWNSFLIDIYNNISKPGKQYFIDAYDVIHVGSGINAYWKENRNNQNTKKNIDNIIKILNAYDYIVKRNNDIDKLEIIPIENGQDSFDIVSKSYIAENNKTIFFHSEDKNIEEDTDNSLFVYNNAFENIDDFLKKVFSIDKYNLVNYFDKEIEEIKENISIQTIKEFINRTFPFYLGEKKCYCNSRNINIIKKFLNKFTLSKEIWKLYNSDKVEQEYVQKLEGVDDLAVFESEYLFKEFKNQFIDYLIFLGLKSNIEFVNSDLDEISKYIACEELKGYYLLILNRNTNEILSENLLEILKKINFIDNESTFEKITRYGKEIICISKEKIILINDKIQQLKKDNKKCHELENSSYCIVELEDYFCIWNKIGANQFPRDKKDKNDKIQSSFVNSFDRIGENFIKNLRMLNLINNIFNLNYAWSGDPVALDLTQFLTSYMALEQEKLSDLMKKGYYVSIKTDNDKIQVADLYFGKKVDIEDMETFLKSIDIEIDVKSFSKYIFVYNDYMKQNIFCPTKMDDTYISNKWLIMKSEDSTFSTLLLEILKCGRISVDSVQKREIQDYFGEYKEKAIIIQELSHKGQGAYSKGTFLNYHKENVELAKKSLPSIWDKSMLEKMCTPYYLNDKQLVEGYDYICPICGSASKAALNAMKFSRFKDIKGKYLYIVSCLNCNKMLSIAKSMEIEEFDAIMREFKNCYIADDEHMKNHLTIKTVYLKVKRYDDVVVRLPMKLSFLNMVLYEKLNSIK